MNKRPECQINGCHNLAMPHWKRKDGTQGYRKLCARHHRKKYGMPISKPKKKRRNFPNTTCVLCGWDKAPCDRHRIKYGIDGGDYEKGNVMILCPNCHRVIHLGKLLIK